MGMRVVLGSSVKVRRTMHMGMARRNMHLGRARDDLLKWGAFPLEDTKGWMCIMEATIGKWKKT